MKELRRNPGYQERKAAFDAEQALRTEALRQAERPIIDDLNHAGVNVASAGIL
jgi:hypothetical protein